MAYLLIRALRPSRCGATRPRRSRVPKSFILNAAIILGALGLYALLGNEVPPLPTVRPALLLDIILTFMIVGLINREEIGWRGFALPRLQERFGVPVTVGVLGGDDGVVPPAHLL